MKMYPPVIGRSQRSCVISAARASNRLLRLGLGARQQDGANPIPGRVLLRDRQVVAGADGPPALDAVVRVAIDDHQVKRMDARLLVRVAAGRPAARARPALL